MQQAIDAGIPLEVCITSTKLTFTNMEQLLTLIDSLDVPIGISSMLFELCEETGCHTKLLQLLLDEYVQFNKMRARLKNRSLIPQCGENVPEVGDGKQSEQTRGGLHSARSSLATIVRKLAKNITAHEILFKLPKKSRKRRQKCK